MFELFTLRDWRFYFEAAKIKTPIFIS